MPSPVEKKLASACEHTDKPEFARKVCQSCYKAQRKAEELETGKVKLDDERGVEAKTGAPVERDFVNDPEAVKEFYSIMWSWLRGAQIEEVWVADKKTGKESRDVRTEARLLEEASGRAMKAATVLGRAYIAERHVEEKPAALPVNGMGDMMAGWDKVIGMKDQLDA